jgi:hypothetical protein
LPTQPLEDLFKQIRRCHAFAADHDPISEAAAVRAGVANLEQSGVFLDAIKDWHKKPAAKCTWDNFKTHFATADKERLHQLTSKGAGYLAEKTTTGTTPTQVMPPTPIPTTTTESKHYYCWSHGLGPNASHTSVTCRKPAPGHRTDATLNNMMGGCNTIHRRHGECPVFGTMDTETTETS